MTAEGANSRNDGRSITARRRDADLSIIRGGNGLNGHFDTREASTRLVLILGSQPRQEPRASSFICSGERSATATGDAVEKALISVAET